MWIRAILSVIAGAYVGGLIATYAMLATDGTSLHDSTLRIYPFYFSLGIMFFTVPGAMMVAGLFERLRQAGKKATIAYPIAILAGTIIGGLVLGALFRSLLMAGVGTAYGFAASGAWAVFHKLVFRTGPSLDATEADSAA